jgi:hypothetical protein
MSPNNGGQCAYRYEFFISYPQMARENEHHLMDDFAAELRAALNYKRQVDQIEMAFRDRDDLRPGFVWEEVIPQMLCRSRCMLLLYNEQYFSRPYCVKEFQAMRRLEGLRGFLGRSKSLIIPLILQSKSNAKGYPSLPPQIAKLSFIDFRAINHPKQQFKQSYVSRRLDELLGQLEQLQRDCLSPIIDCTGFEFEEEVEVSAPPPAPYPGEWQVSI